MRLASTADPRRGEGCAAEVVAVQVVERAPALDRDAQAAKAVVTDCGRYTTRYLLLIVAEEGVGRRAAADLLDPRPAHVVPVLLDHVAVVVLHLRQPVLRVPDKRLLAGQTLVARNHIAVGIIVETVEVADAVHRMVRAGIVVAACLSVEGDSNVLGCSLPNADHSGSHDYSA